MADKHSHLKRETPEPGFTSICHLSGPQPEMTPSQASFAWSVHKITAHVQVLLSLCTGAYCSLTLVPKSAHESLNTLPGQGLNTVPTLKSSTLWAGIEHPSGRDPTHSWTWDELSPDPGAKHTPDWQSHHPPGPEEEWLPSPVFGHPPSLPSVHTGSTIRKCIRNTLDPLHARIYNFYWNQPNKWFLL